MRQQLMAICALLLLAACGHSREQGPSWPTVEWQVSSPADQEMNEARLAALESSLSDQHGNIDGMLVTRNGFVVYETSYERDYRRWAGTSLPARGGERDRGRLVDAGR
ncbi:MAG: hypothetical protein AMS18_11425 [Gemmatimonas sp. SG8_17]|nr:MAG: hypothetical protein AMS18_11425 [Gemmatimonas sp. SG8_17]